jgi:hypothetical protein
MTKNLILQEFQALKCIKSIDALHTYIDFCLSNHLLHPISGRSSSHHILPRAKTLPFVKFANLKLNHWNKAELLYYDHYYAHYLLTCAVDHQAILHSFIAMHNRDLAC